jgi:FKBP-type peptidyl-prolyl cis-trans isomerase 2
MARIKKEKEKSNVLMLVLVAIMFFGTIAGGLLFQTPRQEDQPLLTTPPPPPTVAPQEKTVTIRHNPVNTTLLTPTGYQTTYHTGDTIFVDSNHPLANKTLAFDISVTNATRANFTGAPDTVEIEAGDTIKVNYTGRLESGEVFDTSHPGIAGNESLPKVSWFSVRPFYQPLEFTVGSGQMIQGFDEAVVGMKINETKTVEIPAEKGYGLHNPSLVQGLPITQEVEKTMEIRRYIELTTEEFARNFGVVNVTQGQEFNVPGTNFNASIFYSTGNTTVIEMMPTQGEVVRIYDYPWNSTVVSVTSGYINLEHDIESGDVIQYPRMPWNSTVL